MSTATTPTRLLTGNEACALAALAAGVRFYAGYPITPSSEVAEYLSKLLPLNGGVFIGMEDEIASIGAIIGASLTGTKSMTATSGPGFSLMQENLGYACMTEVPIVVVNVMRGGPSTGLPTLPAQGDVMQARWGTHGDHPIIALTPYSVGETYELTIRAFNLSEKYRVPVLLLLDETLGHVNEKVTMPDPTTIEIVNRTEPSCPPEEYLAYRHTESGVPEMASIGDGYRHHVTGLFHDETGFQTNDNAEIDKLMRRLHRKIDQARDDIVEVDPYLMEDADIGIVAYGSAARASRHAIRLARQNGVKVGMVRPRTLWPFIEKEIRSYANQVKAWIVPEMNLGQIAHEVEWAVQGRAPVHKVNRVDGCLIEPGQILEKIEEVR
jgi:2-oxoglutarate ferredoxin oxidoreductase subunit alpha